MNFQILSDVHGEFYGDRGLGFCENLPVAANNLILAGDTNTIRYLKGCLQILADKFENVILVPGNHEYYHENPHTVNALLEAYDSFMPNVHILQNREIEINGVTVAGTTLWFNNKPEVALFKSLLSDFRVIKEFETWVYEENQRAREFLRGLTQADIIITHHSPTFASVCEWYKFDKATELFYVDPVLDAYDYNCSAKFWIHGHTHFSADRFCGNTRVIANAVGYNHSLNPNCNRGLTLSL